MKKLDFLTNTSLRIYQDDEMFKINSDTVRLGEFIKINRNNYTLVDVGTNNGALIMYAYNKKNDGFYYGVDINDKALSIAKENFEMNGITNYELFNMDYKDLKLDKPVDYIVANPPYFDGENVSLNKDKRKARFSEYLPLETLISTSKRLLKQEGTLFMVYPAFKLANVIALLDKYKFGVKRLQFVYDENKEDAVVFLVEARKEMKHYVKVEGVIVNKR